MKPSPRATPPVLSVTRLVLLITLLSGCATTRDAAETRPEGAPAEEAAATYDGTYDPFEPFNRAMYTFNEKFDRYLLRPVAKGYRAVAPRSVRRGVTNFFSNLHDPAIMVNNILQGKFADAASDLGRFLTNSTVGVFGLFDVGSKIGLEKHNEDLGQTLAVWGIGDGPYLVLPFFGPSNIRDGIGLYGDLQMYPPTHVRDDSTFWMLYGLEGVDTRAQLLEAGDILEQAAGEDPYIFVREAYRQRRQNLIGGDAATQGPAPLDPSIFEEDQPGDKSRSPREPSPATGS